MDTYDFTSPTRRECLPPEFLEGDRCACTGDWQTARWYFERADQRAAVDDPHRNLYAAAHGLSMVHLGDFRGINLCRQAAAEEVFDARVFEQLARAELHLKHRRQACTAIQRGLRIDPGNMLLRTLRKRMGTRRQPVLTFLSRENPLNRMLGRITYRQR